MNDWKDYKDPKDLRDLSVERLEFESNQMGMQFTEWNNLFDVMSAIRVKMQDKMSELDRFCIYSNRFLIMDREHLSDYKLFTKEEVLRLIAEAFNDGWQNGRYSEEEKTLQHEQEAAYLKKKEKI